jgi:hypothetical protein
MSGPKYLALSRYFSRLGCSITFSRSVCTTTHSQQQHSSKVRLSSPSPVMTLSWRRVGVRVLSASPAISSALDRRPIRWSDLPLSSDSVSVNPFQYAGCPFSLLTFLVFSLAVCVVLGSAGRCFPLFALIAVTSLPTFVSPFSSRASLSRPCWLSPCCLASSRFIYLRPFFCGFSVSAAYCACCFIYCVLTPRR